MQNSWSSFFWQSSNSCETTRQGIIFPDVAWRPFLHFYPFNCGHCTLHCSNQSLLITSWLLKYLGANRYFPSLIFQSSPFLLTSSSSNCDSSGCSEPHCHLSISFHFPTLHHSRSTTHSAGGRSQRAQRLHPPPPRLSHRPCRSCRTPSLQIHRATQGGDNQQGYWITGKKWEEYRIGHF